MPELQPDQQPRRSRISELSHFPRLRAKPVNPDAYIEMAETEERHWWHRARRAVLQTLIRGLALPPAARILEIGAGTGGNLQMLSQFGHVRAIELDDAALAIAIRKTGGRVDIQSGSCPDRIPFSSERFDLIVLLDVLEHIHDENATLAAVRGMLSSRGYVLLTVPAYRWLWSAHDEFLYHKRRYRKIELQRLVQAAGLATERITYFNTLLFPLAAAMRLTARMSAGAASHGRTIPPEPLNGLLGSVFAAERFLLRRFDLPFGVSLLAILRRA
jgi:SAM-dependent methyltransferase